MIQRMNPTILACAQVEGHIVDLWRDPATGRWCVGNDDRSLVVDTPETYSADDALDAYLEELPRARAMLDDDPTEPRMSIELDDPDALNPAFWRDIPAGKA